MSKLWKYRGIVKVALSAALIILINFAILPGIGMGQPITEGFNGFDLGTRPAGWTFNGCNADSDTYTGAGDFGLASPSIKLDTTGDYIQTQTLFHPGALQFWVKGMGTDASSALLVEEYSSGGGWNTLTNVSSLPASGTNFGPYSMDFFATAARFTYAKSAGDLAFDDVDISAAVLTPIPTPTQIPAATPTAYVPSPTPIPQTAIYNPSFEMDPVPPPPGWTLIATGSTARSNEQAHAGTYSCKFGDPTTTYSSRGIQCDEVNITVGVQYTFSGWFYLLNEGTGVPTDTLFKFEIEWLDSGHGSIGSYVDEDWSVAAFDTWSEHTVVNTAPANAEYFKLYIACKEVNNPDNDAYIDLFSYSQPSDIDITSPIAGDAWYIGESRNITWDWVGISPNIDIHYSTNGTDWAPITTNIANSGTYPWTIPDDPSSQAQVRVRETGGGGVSDESGQFTIAAVDSINVDTPAAGQTWYYSSTLDIVWHHGPAVLPINDVDIDFSDDGGTTWTTITTGVGLDSSPYFWTIPDNVDSANCLIRVCQQVTGICGQSGVFTISPPTFSVTSPAGGETWYFDDTETITWTYTVGITGNVDIDYSTNGISGPWAGIASNQPNTGSFSPWTIPNAGGSACRVRISEIVGVSEPGISATDFTIVGPPIPQPYSRLGWEVHGDLSRYECGLKSIEAIDVDHIWVGGLCSKIFFFDGTDWYIRTEIGTNTLAIGATGIDDVWFGQEYGYAYNYNGGGFWDQALPKTDSVVTVNAVDPNNIWMSASKYAFHSDGIFSSWTTYTVEESGTIKDMLFLRPYRGWVLKNATSTTDTRVLYTEDGNNWSIQTTFGKWSASALTGCLDQNGIPLLWVVGACGEIYYSGDGGLNWILQDDIREISWNCAEALDQNNVWISGGGYIYHYNGSQWIFETDEITTLGEISAVDNTHVYGIPSTTTNKKVYCTFAYPSPTPDGFKTPTPKPIPSTTPTPYGFETPSPTPVPIPGPISGRVYDRETGEGVYNLYVRALPIGGGLMAGGARTDSNGNYTVTKPNGSGLAAGLYYMYVDSTEGGGEKVYRSQWYNQKDTQADAVGVASNSTGIDFPLYKKDVYPTPVPTPSPDFQAIRVANGDYSGDGLSDIAIFRENSGLWAVRAVTRLYFGTSGDIPVSGDYDGDGTADVAIFRNSSGLWAIRDISRIYFGASSDLPVPGDYDGDGSCDIGIFRDSSGLWAVKDITRNYFGSTSDQPVAGDYDGDGRDDFAIFRKSSGLWALKDISRIYHGSSFDTPVSGDYNGTGTAAPAIYRSSSGLWSIRNISRVYFGGAADQPVLAGFSGADDISIFRQSSGLWAIRGITRVYFGSTDDLPITR